MNVIRSPKSVAIGTLQAIGMHEVRWDPGPNGQDGLDPGP